MIGIGGSTYEKELQKIKPFVDGIPPITLDEFESRIQKATKLLQASDGKAMYLHAGTNLLYFTGTKWQPSERMVGAILFDNGEIEYISPKFEEGTIADFKVVPGKINCWEEHESPYSLFFQILREHQICSGRIYMDESTPFFHVSGLLKMADGYYLEDAKRITASCRMIKSKQEIAIIQRAMDITLAVQKSAARILREGITTAEVVGFIDEAHKKFGITSGSYFCIVLFGKDSAFPHGVKSPKPLDNGDMVLIDTGCVFHNYISDITRSYVFGSPTEKQRQIWNIEKETQQAAFKAAKIGNTCSDIDTASRKTLEKHNLGPDYQLPGLPHRTGHGIGLDIHEWPYIVKNDHTIIRPGMCFSNEPMICIPNAFGVRHEDHIYITENGPAWFTTPMFSLDNPFGYSKSPKKEKPH